jgi:hypothetical protein
VKFYKLFLFDIFYCPVTQATISKMINVLNFDLTVSTTPQVQADVESAQLWNCNTTPSFHETPQKNISKVFLSNIITKNACRV